MQLSVHPSRLPETKCYSTAEWPVHFVSRCLHRRNRLSLHLSSSSSIQMWDLHDVFQINDLNMARRLPLQKDHVAKAMISNVSDHL